MSVVKHPEITVRLTGTDGNAFMIMGNVQSALRRGGVDRDEINQFLAEAMSGDYDNLLAVVCKWVSVS